MVKISGKAIRSAFAIVFLTLAFSCQKQTDKTPALQEEIVTKAIPPRDLKDFTQVNLVGDNDEYDPARIDPNMVNGWGISFPASGPGWVSTEGTRKSLVLNGDGSPVAISPVTIPPAGPLPSSHPTGQVFIQQLILNYRTEIRHAASLQLQKVVFQDGTEGPSRSKR